MSTTDNKDEGFPWIIPQDMPKWKVLFFAHLRPKKGDLAINYSKPKLNEEDLATLLGEDKQETEASKAYKEIHKLNVKKWAKRNDIAYSALVKACTRSPSATTVILDNPNATAGKLFKKLMERFDQSGMTGVVQAKLAEFNL